MLCYSARIAPSGGIDHDFWFAPTREKAISEKSLQHHLNGWYKPIYVRYKRV
jgi:hypothetical protein